MTVWREPKLCVCVCVSICVFVITLRTCDTDNNISILIDHSRLHLTRLIFVLLSIFLKGQFYVCLTGCRWGVGVEGGHVHPSWFAFNFCCVFTLCSSAKLKRLDEMVGLSNYLSSFSSSSSTSSFFFSSSFILSSSLIPLS